MGKFTIIEETPSTTGQDSYAETASQESQPTSPQDSVEPFTLKTKQTTRRGKTARPKPVIQAVSEAPANYNLWAQLMIGSTNTVVVTWLGSECAMERREAEMLEPPLARILQRLPTSQAQKMATFIDPMIILIALGTWGNRIIRIQRAKKPGGIPVEELMRANGVSGPQGHGVTPTQAETSSPEVAEDIPIRQKVEVNPNGVPVAITQQMGEV